MKSGLTRPTYGPRTCFLFHVHSVQYYGVLRACRSGTHPRRHPRASLAAWAEAHLQCNTISSPRISLRLVFWSAQSATTRMRALDGPGLGYTRRARCLPTNPDHGMCTIRARLAGLHTPPSSSIHSIANSGIPSLYTSGSARATPRSRQLWLSRRILLASEPDTARGAAGRRQPFRRSWRPGAGGA